jgi:hypothetical protein
LSILHGAGAQRQLTARVSPSSLETRRALVIRIPEPGNPQSVLSRSASSIATFPPASISTFVRAAPS